MEFRTVTFWPLASRPLYLRMLQSKMHRRRNFGIEKVQRQLCYALRAMTGKLDQYELEAHKAKIDAECALVATTISESKVSTFRLLHDTRRNCQTGGKP